MIRALAIFFLFVFSQAVSGQFSFRANYSIPVTENGIDIRDPFTGGYNNAQFGEIDINLDGIVDLIVYDRARGFIRPYINAGIADSVSYTYAPEYEELFPEMDQFLVTTDYNNDGKIDIISGSSALRLYENTSNSTEGLKFEFQGSILSRFNSASNPTAINPTSSNYPGVIDIDQDGDIDFFINESPRRIDYHRNLSIDSNNNYNSDIQRRSRCWGLFFEDFNSDSTQLDSVYLDSCFLLGNRGRGERLGSKGLKHGTGLTISALDLDGNSSTDILIADDGSYTAKMMLNADSIGPPYVNSRIYKVLDSFPNYDTPIHLLFSIAFFIDVNNDGRKDMLVASNQQNGGIPPFSREDVWYYENTSSTNEYRFNLKTKSFLKDHTLDFGTGSKPIFFDYNKDGLQDILVGNVGNLKPNDSTTFVAQLALLENTGTINSPRFELIDRNYLDVPSFDFGIQDTLLSLISPSAGDIDGDGDTDLLVTLKNGEVYLFEDTATSGAPAEFKIHTTPFQNLSNRFIRYNYSDLYDVDNDGSLEIITGNQTTVQYHINFGTRTQPIFNIPLDSFYRIGQDTMRYHLSNPINYSKIQVGDSLAVNNAVNPNNTPNIVLVVTNIDSSNHFIDCINTIFGGVSDNRFDERVTTAFIKEFEPNWDFFTIFNGLIIENTFFFRDNNDTTQVFLGAQRGDSYFFENFGDELVRIDSVEGIQRNTISNFGFSSFIDGADINNDGFIDLIVGFEAGGLKVLFGEEPVGLSENTIETKQVNNLFNVYPNPSNQFTTIELLGKNVNASLELLDISGKLIQIEEFKSQLMTLNVSSLSQGVYLIRLINDSQVQTKKLIVQP